MTREEATLRCGWLTGRELQVLSAFGDGLDRRQAARRLGISTRTLDAHTHHIYRKLGVQSRWQALAAVDQMWTVAS